MSSALFVIITYLVICLISYSMITNDYILSKKNRQDNRGVVKLKYSSIILISTFFTLYNLFVTTIISNNVLGSDRINYQVEFEGLRSVASIGLQFVFNVVKILGGNIYIAFYLSTFLCLSLVLIAYRKSNLATPKLLLLFFASEYIFFTFTALKQAYAVAFACLFFVSLLEKETRKNDFYTILNIVLSILFHSSGFVLIPIYFIVKIYEKNNKSFKLGIIFIVLSIIFFSNIILLINHLIGSLVPILSNKINFYFSENDFGLNEHWTAAFKYIPFSYISFWGLLNRQFFKKIYKYYDRILLSSTMGGLIVLYSIFVYWFSRFRFTFLFPAFLLFDLIDSNERIESNRIINNTIVFGGTLLITLRNVWLIMINHGAF